ncbi:hypothetical protein JB92DRAFT_3120984 [Gautieria morchelliformis]|nr:hypothetical protein JB92DRAFT_3120984 [Gautieria morchelliformis]
MYISLAGQQLAEEKERRERNQHKKAAQAAHNKKEPRSQKHSADDAISPNQSHRAPLPDIIRPRCDHQDHETNDDGDNDDYPTGEEDNEEEMEENGPMSAREAALESEFTAPRDFERARPTQRHGSQHTIAASSPIPSSQRDRVIVPAGTATRSSPGPRGSSRERTGIAHPTLPHVSQHSIAAGSSISSGQRKVVPDPPSGFREATTIIHRKSQHSIVASSSISSSQRQVVPDTLDAFRETTAITHQKSLVSLEDSSSEEDTAPARGLKRPRTMSPNSDPESETPGNQVDDPVEEDTPAERQPKHQCDRKGRARPRASDYEGLEQGVLKLAQAEFQVRVCMEYVFPEEQDVDVETWAMACWDNACEHKAVKYEMSAAHTCLIVERVSTIRGRVKDKVVERVVSHYGFKTTNKDYVIQANKELAGKLLEDDGYIFEDVATSMGIYEHPILQDVINAQWFSKKKKSDGIVFGSAFNPIPDPVIALVFTVEYAIKQWASGFLVSGSQFSEVDYHDVYKRHLDGLEQWRHFSTRTAQALARHQQRLYSFGRSRAGFHDVPERAKTRFDNAKLARAAAAIRDASDEE